MAVRLRAGKRSAKRPCGAAGLVPEGPTTFIRRPRVERVDELGADLVRVALRASVPPGREWLAERFFADLLRQQARDGLITHGPVVFAVDGDATRSYARATATTRRDFRTAVAR